MTALYHLNENIAHLLEGFAAILGELDLIMEELLVSPDSRLNGKNLINSEIRKKYDVIVVAIKRQDGSMLFNPKPDTVILAGDILIVLGASEQIAGLGREM